MRQRGALRSMSSGAAWLSWRCPSVISNSRGRPSASAIRWILEERPPRERPMDRQHHRTRYVPLVAEQPVGAIGFVAEQGAEPVCRQSRLERIIGLCIKGPHQLDQLRNEYGGRSRTELCVIDIQPWYHRANAAQRRGGRHKHELRPASRLYSGAFIWARRCPATETGRLCGHRDDKRADALGRISPG